MGPTEEISLCKQTADLNIYNATLCIVYWKWKVCPLALYSNLSFHCILNFKCVEIMFFCCLKPESLIEIAFFFLSRNKLYVELLHFWLRFSFKDKLLKHYHQNWF